MAESQALNGASQVNWNEWIIKRVREGSFGFTLVYLCSLYELCLGFNICSKLYVNHTYCDVLIVLRKPSPLRGIRTVESI